MWTGLLDWTAGLDCWVGLLDWTAGLDCWVGLLDWIAGLDCWVGLLGWISALVSHDFKCSEFGYITFYTLHFILPLHTIKCNVVIALRTNYRMNVYYEQVCRRAPEVLTDAIY